MPTRSQSKLTVAPLYLSFDPHLLLELEFADISHMALLDRNEKSGVQFVYNGKSSPFKCHILNGDKAIAGNKLQIAVELVNDTLHYGHFTTGTQVSLAADGNLIANGTVTEVLDQHFMFWSSNNLPEAVKDKAPMLSEEDVTDFLLSLEFDLITLNFIEDYSIDIDGGNSNFVTIELSIPNKTLTLLQAKRLEKIFRDECFGACFYKADYVPFYYGDHNVLMQSYTALFATANKTEYITGVVKIV